MMPLNCCLSYNNILNFNMNFYWLKNNTCQQRVNIKYKFYQSTNQNAHPYGKKRFLLASFKIYLTCGEYQTVY